MPYVSPVPAGTAIGRTDQGVDTSVTPGGQTRAIGLSKYIGQISNWYAGQPLYWFELMRRVRGRLVGTGRFWYEAEQVRLNARPGQIFQPGQAAGTVPSSGTGQEFGWATASGQTLAQATTGYTEGQVTPAGSDFRTAVIAGGRSRAVALSFRPCLLTWYDPALGGTNSASGARAPHSATASGEPYSPTALTCAAPPQYPFGTMVTFRYQGRTVTCRVNDRGGAIVGAHFDLARRPAEILGVIQAGSVNAEFAVGGSGGSSRGGFAGRARPGGQKDTGAAVAKVFDDYLALRDEPRGGGPTFTSTGSPLQDFFNNFVGAANNVFGGGN